MKPIAMKLRPVFLPLAVIGIALVIAISMMSRQPQLEAHSEARQAPAVQYQLAQPATAALTIMAQGTVTPAQKVVLTSEVAGRVMWVSPLFKLGEIVRKGDTLIKIDTTGFELNVSNALSALREAELALAQEAARSAQASEDWSSMESSDAPALSQRLPQLNAATAKVEAARAQLKKAQQDLQRCDIRAPFDAVIDTKAVEFGQFVASNAQIAQLLGITRAEVRLPVAFERSLLLAPAGNKTPVELTDDTQPGIRWQATLARFDQQINADTRVVYATVVIDKPYSLDPPLRLGQFVSATLPGKTLENALRLPRQAIFRDQGSKGHVFVVDGKNTLQKMDVEILATEPGTTIVGGIKAGERVVVTRLEVMANGMQVSASPLAISSADKNDSDKTSAEGS